MKILVATDLSKLAKPAIARAADLAARHDASLFVLHVVDADPSLIPPEAAENDSFEGASEALEQQVAEYAMPRGIACERRVEQGKPFVEIVHTARETGASLIVVGAHGRHLLRDWLLGTTAERVVRKGDRPVLVVRRPPEGPYRHVLVGTDFSPASREALRMAAELAPEARITLAHAWELWYEERFRTSGVREETLRRLVETTERKISGQMEEEISACGLVGRNITPVVSHGYPPRVLTELADTANADLVAVGTQGLGGMQYVLLGSVAEHVLREAPCDVLAVRLGARHFELP